MLIWSIRANLGATRRRIAHAPTRILIVLDIYHTQADKIPSHES